ncbi:MAG: acetyl-CoA decarbonylase/synthase complex subunit gamma, partial [Planctomycetota bacterium]|nr:acetyl-CoA decarbonylase/synthase complex subunit gamma [Planctomycetota bacterium]
MALTGLQIQKLLPGTNCKECGSNTCLAFAMKLAAKKAELSQCPYASEEAKRVLGAAAEPPVRTIGLGPDKKLTLGGETVLYRHEKTFVSAPALAVNVNDTDAPTSIGAALQAIADYRLERVGEKFGVAMVAVTHQGEAREPFVALAKQAWEKTQKPLVLRSRDPEALAAAATAVKGSGSVLACATAETFAALVACARENGQALALTANTIDDLAALSAEAKKSGFNEIVLCLPSLSPAEQFQINSIARRAALKDNYKPLGYPFLRFLPAEAEPLLLAAEATLEICKYGGIVVLPRFDKALLASLLTLRLNIYTDPQKPIQVEPKLYAIGDPKPDSPVFVTTNFSLTYFIVSGEIENAGISAWLVVPECEGMSVLTAWAAGKFNGGTIAKFMKEKGIDQQL